LDILFTKKIILETIKKLEKMGLIKISYCEGEIYGFMETEKGSNLLTMPKYQDWYGECGD
jgi:hypothetical protein